MKTAKVSIIVPVKKSNPNLDECIKCCLKLNYSNFEIIILPDEPFVFNHPIVKIIPTAAMGPSEKRDLGLRHATGEIIAFIDDDAYPTSNWLIHAIPYFENSEIAAVCGPAVTPADDNIYQTTSGLIYSSLLASGKHSFRYIPKETREVDDYPSCNFIMRKEIMRKIGGFGNEFWPGEDTILCLKITSELNKKIIYDPNILVYHHRRPIFIPHLKQVAAYGLHRGYFAKKFPENSLKFSYFIPSIFVAGLISGFILSLFSSIVAMIYIGVVILYFLLVSIEAIRLKSPNIFLTISGIFLTHTSYGIFFLKGLLSRNLRK